VTVSVAGVWLLPAFHTQASLEVKNDTAKEIYAAFKGTAI
jgi:hypothetical protein